MNIQKLSRTAQQLGDGIMHMHMHNFLTIMHISRVKHNIWIEKTFSYDNLNKFFCWRSKFKNLCFGSHQVCKRSKTIKPLNLRPLGFKCFWRMETWWNPRTRFLILFMVGHNITDVGSGYISLEKGKICPQCISFMFRVPLTSSYESAMKCWEFTWSFLGSNAHLQWHVMACDGITKWCVFLKSK